jgi:putative AdoMet-dependent methyltransferase
MTISHDPFPASDFDPWAASYDQSVQTDGFPFTGYHLALETCLRLAEARPGMSVLDLGTGTGNLALRFAALGCELWCTDFSEKMLEKARAKLPAAQFALHDLRAAFPPEFERRFERIVSGYVFHHFEQPQKVQICAGLLRERLTLGGKLVIADIAFADAEARDAAKRAEGENWDEEFYWLAGKDLPALEKAGLRASFQPVSSCAGVFVITGG